jgi:Short C-terminal domain
MGEWLAQPTQLGELMKAGILTEAEFQQQKARVLNG